MEVNICSNCLQVVLKAGGVKKSISCCDIEMDRFIFDEETLNEDDSHIIKVRKIGNFVTVSLEDHPKIAVHHIEFILLETDKGFHFKDICGFEEVKAEFVLSNDENIKKVYANCNSHSLICVNYIC